MAKNCVNFGVIGAGGIAYRRTIPGMLKAKNCRLAAVMDPVGVERVASEFGVAIAYTREADLLADPEVQPVYIASPVHCHLKQIQLAAAAGKHILCEKPLGLTYADAREVEAVATGSTPIHMVAFTFRFVPALRYLKRLVSEGHFGEIRHWRMSYFTDFMLDPATPVAWRNQRA